MRRFLLLILLFLVPQMAFAAMPNLFTPPVGDYSIRYLADIFGVVDGVLHGTGTQIMGTIFGVLNSALLVLAGIVFSYIAFVGVLKTAEEGKMLGQKWSSIWIPLRAMIGFALIVPKATGYSFIQIFVLWIVVQGVGVADTLWSSALGYIQKGGVLIQPTPPSAMVNVGLLSPAASVYKSQICMNAIYNSLHNNNTNPDVQIPTFVPSQPTWTDTSQTQVKISFPGKTMVGSTNYEGVCGFITWKPADDDATALTQGQILAIEQLLEAPPYNLSHPAAQGYADTLGTMRTAIKFLQNKLPNQTTLSPPPTPQQIASIFPHASTTFSDSRSVAVKQMVVDVMPLAQQVANTIIPPTATSSSATTSVQDSLWELLRGRYDIANAATDYVGIMQPYFNRLALENQTNANLFISKSEGQGWVMAGAYYYNLAQLNNAAMYTEKPTSIPVATYSVDFSTCQTNSNSLFCVGANAVPPAIPDWKKLANILDDTQTPSAGANPIDSNIWVNMQYSPGGTPGVGSDFIGTSSDAAGTVEGVIAGQGVKSGDSVRLGSGIFSWIIPLPGDPSGAITKTLTEPFTDFITGGVPSAIQQLGNPGADPLLSISALGVTLINWVEKVWISGAVSIFGIQLLGALFSVVNPVGTAIMSTLLWFIPLLMTILLSMLVAGATMAYYVPLIPFILFLFAALGWFIGVIESMIAAPLVALGMAHPEGDDIMGKGEPAIMLILNLFLRPSLIIIGFIAGIMLSHVGLWLLNQGISNAMSLASPDWLGGIISIIAGVVIYVAIVLAVMNKSFALIHEVPDKVMRWMSGGQQAQFGDSGQGLQEVSGKMEAGMGAAKGGFEAAQPVSERGKGGAADMGRSMREVPKSSTSGVSAGGAETPPAGGGGGGGEEGH